MYEGAISMGGRAVASFKPKEEFIEDIENILPEKATILVKASRGMHFEKIIEKLRSEE